MALLVGVVTTVATTAFFFSFDHPWTLRLDNKLVHFPLTLDAYRRWMAGEIPHWSNGLWGGIPLLANPLTAAFYIPHLLPFWLTPDPHLRAFDLATALHAGILTAGTVYLLGELGVGRAGSLFGAALTFLGPQVHWWAAGLLPPFAALAWWPWTMAGAERLARPERSLGPSLVLCSAVLAAQVLAGYPEFALYSGSMAGLWLITRRAGLSLPARLVRVVVLGLAATLLASPQLLPSAMELADSNRAATPPHSGLAFGVPPVPPVLDPRAALDMSWPVFLGAAAVLLAAWAVLSRTPRSLFLACVALSASVLGFGHVTPFHGLLTSIPPFHLFRVPPKFFALTDFALIWLAALGLQRLLHADGHRRIGMVAASLLAVVAIAERSMYATLRLPLYTELPRTVAPPRELPLGTLLEALRMDIMPVASQRSGNQPPPRILIAAPNAYFGNLGILYGLESLRGGTTAFVSSRNPAFFDEPLQRGHLDLFGVQFVFVSGQECTRYVQSHDLEIVSRTARGCLLRNPSRPARYALLAEARPVASEPEMRALVRREPRGAVPVWAPPDEVRLRSVGTGSAGTVRVVHYRPGTVELGVHAARDSLLFVRESWKKSWRAVVDGEGVPVYQAGGAFFAVPVPAGTHDVSLIYQQPGVVAGLAGAAIWIVFATVVVWPLRPRRG